MPKVLVVDDVAVNRELIAVLLHYAGHEVHEAADGETALAQVREHRPDLVVCDILMPTMDGYEFVRRLREDAAVAATEIIFYTATFMEHEARQLAAACGVHHVLTKPCDPEAILATVAAALSREKAPQSRTTAAAVFDRAHLRLVSDKLVEKVTQLEHANKRLGALIDLSVQLASEREPAVLLEKFCQGMRALFGAGFALLSVRDNNAPDTRQMFAAGLPAAESAALHAFQLPAAIADSLVGDRASCRIERRHADSELGQVLDALAPRWCGAVLAPVASLYHVYGWILLVDKLDAGSFSDDDERTLAIQAAQVGRIYENGSLYAKVQQQMGLLQAQVVERERNAALLRLEHTVARALAAADNMADGLGGVLRAVCEAQRWSTGRYWQVDADAGMLRLAMEWNAAEPARAVYKVSTSETLRPGEGLAGRVWDSGQPMWVPDLRTDERVKFKAALREAGQRCAALFPLFSDGHTIGVLSFGSANTRQPDAREQASVRVIGHQLGQFVQRKTAEAALQASEHFTRSTLDSLLEHVCVLDSGGTILTVNQAWRDFASVKGGSPLRVPQGANYLAACAGMSGDARALGAGIEDVICGRQSTFAMEYRYDGPSERRWFVGRVSRFAGTGPERVVVAHEDITERKHAEERIGRLHRVSAVLSDINALIVRVGDRDELFREACRIGVNTGRFKKAWIGTFQPAQRHIEIVAAHDDGTAGDYFQQVEEGLHEFLCEGNAQFDRLVIHQQPIIVNDIAATEWMATREAALATGSRSIAALPLVMEKKTVGMLLLHADEVDFFDAQEVKLLLELAGDLSFAMDHILQADQLNRLAYYDALTGHANTMLFNERLSRFIDAAQADNRPLALAVVDIERFKAINDLWGRHTGDDVLRQVATRILQSLEDRSRMARVGPDQFGIVFPNAPHGMELARVLNEFYQGCFGQPYAVGKGTIHVAAHIGLACLPVDGHDNETLFRNAEAAVKRAKRSAERVLFYDARMTEIIAEKSALENRLRDALREDRFVLHYQPKVDAQDRRIVGLEALIRWRDPELGLVSPVKFIPLMEETGLIVEVGSWALRQAAHDRRSWLRRGLWAPRIAVNVSAVQLRKRGFVETVRAALDYEDGAAGIDIEVTESAAMEEVEDTVAKLQVLRAHGIDLAIDDFGTGYSSLAYLSKLPAQVLKIDRAFTMSMCEDTNAFTLVSTMVSLAHALHMKVVAEGVETEQQAAMLQQLGCDQLQGYLISRPVDEEAVSAMLVNGAR